MAEEAGSSVTLDASRHFADEEPICEIPDSTNSQVNTTPSRRGSSSEDANDPEHEVKYRATGSSNAPQLVGVTAQRINL